MDYERATLACRGVAWWSALTIKGVMEGIFPTHRALKYSIVRIFSFRENPVSSLLKLALLIDKISHSLGKFASWAVLAAAMISAGNAFVRYGFDISSNGWLEIQWYLFATTVMLGAPIVLKLNEHVRVDILYGKLGEKGSVMVDLFGLVFFLLPVMVLLLYFSWPLFLKMFLTGEMSQNAGGLIRWPAMMLLPLGFGWMLLQGLSEIVKRVAYLQGSYNMDIHYEKPVQ
jgi:hypothetical protein